MVSRLQQLFKIKLPILQAPMAGVQGSALAIAVSGAGGLGSLPCAMLDRATLLAELELLKMHPDKSFNLNFFCHDSTAAAPAEVAKWSSALKPYYAEFGVEVPPTGPPSSSNRLPFDKKMAEVVLEYQPAVVSFHFGLPAPDLLDTVRKSGAKIVSTATTVEEAIWLEAHGVDAVIAQGIEAGGHRGMFLSSDVGTQMGLFALLPQVVKAVKVPVIAAGGIADARGVRAALLMGASAAQVGTSYLLCPEARTPTLHRHALRRDVAKTTALTNIFTGKPARGIVNRFMREMGPINASAPKFPAAATCLAILRSSAEAEGCCDFSPMWAGQNVSGCKEIPASELTAELAAFTDW